MTVFGFGAALAFLAAIASLLRGGAPAARPSEPRAAATEAVPAARPSEPRPSASEAALAPAPAAGGRPGPKPSGTVPASDPRTSPSPTEEIRTMALTTIDPGSALVVIDLQKGIVSARADDAVTAAVKQAAHLAAEFRRHGLPVVLVNVTGRAPGRTESGRSAGTAALPADWADLIDELDVRPTDHLITKRRRSAFHDTGLDTLLRDLGVTQIVFAGISTSAGVESSARSASDYGYHVVLATDAMYDPDAASHRHSVERVFPKIGETATAAEVVEKVEATR